MKKGEVFSSSTVNNFLQKCGGIGSEGDNPDNAKMPVLSELSVLHEQGIRIRMTMISIKDPINAVERNSALERGRTFAFLCFL